MAVVPYMNLEDVSSRMVNVHRLFQQQLEYISEFTQNEDGGDRLVQYNRDFRVAYYTAAQVSDTVSTSPGISGHDTRSSLTWFR